MTGRTVAIVGLALLGLAISSDLAAFQLRLVPSVWDPIFGRGSERVLTLVVSRALPVPDASIGAAAYALDAILGILVGLRLWRPAVLASALAILATLGAVIAIGLAIAQPLVARAGCTLCLCSTAISIALAAGAVAEAREQRHHAAADPHRPGRARMEASR